jgi:hypothetical protein
MYDHLLNKIQIINSSNTSQEEKFRDCFYTLLLPHSTNYTSPNIDLKYQCGLFLYEFQNNDFLLIHTPNFLQSLSQEIGTTDLILYFKNLKFPLLKDSKYAQEIINSLPPSLQIPELSIRVVNPDFKKEFIDTHILIPTTFNIKERIIIGRDCNPQERGGSIGFTYTWF